MIGNYFYKYRLMNVMADMCSVSGLTVETGRVVAEVYELLVEVSQLVA